MLVATGYTAALTADRVLHVTCGACAVSGVVSQWLLTALEEAARAEFSATAYPSTGSTSPR
ncbi:hypothetical protein [Allokutzneria albata]|uniref:hypothetical protein n=1 Tax=Allokutzneria albata TaxID=211114 RepID=UPI0012FC1115|nr:hypothetical protein [Allokutzneria albata]